MTDYPRYELGERLYMDRNGDLRPAEEMDLPPLQPIPWKIHNYSAGLQSAMTKDPTQNRAARRKARYREKGKGRIT